MAWAMPGTSRLGIRLVKSEPGPMVIRSARAMASRVCGRGLNIRRIEKELLDTAAAGGDLGFAANPGTIFHQGFEFDVRSGRGIDVSASKQNFRRQADGLAEVAGDGGQRRQKQIAEAVTFEARSFHETMLKQAGEQGFVFGEGDDAVADVARRQHVELFAQASAGAAVVADRDHGAQFADLGWSASCQRAGTGDVALQTFEQGGKTGAAADGDDTQAATCEDGLPSR